MCEERIKVLIADDDVLACEALRQCLLDASIDVVGVVHNGAEAIGLVESLRPDVIVWDDSIPDMSGLEAIKRIKITYPLIPVMVLTMKGTPSEIADVLAEGAYALFEKERLDLRLLPNIIRLLTKSNRAIIGSSALKSIMAKVGRQESVRLPKNEKFFAELYDLNGSNELTLREFEILQLYVNDYGDQQIAAELSMGIEAVKATLDCICGKLGIEDLSRLRDTVFKFSGFDNN